MKILLLVIMLCSCFYARHPKETIARGADDAIQASDFPTTPLIMFH